MASYMIRTRSLETPDNGIEGEMEVDEMKDDAATTHDEMSSTVG
ncbi:MAG: hypothetical protein ABL959_07965 [Pyrinomonadaceae bacterium]